MLAAGVAYPIRERMMTHTPPNEPTRAGTRGTSPPTATSSQETAPRRRRTSAELLRVLYDQLRELAHARMAREPGGGAGMTLQPTALVHEAYLRIAGDSTGAAEKD